MRIKSLVLLKSLLAFTLIFSFQILDLFETGKTSSFSSLHQEEGDYMFVNRTSNTPSILIYSSHQYEEYESEGVKQGARYLSILLSNKGYQVELENNDFENYKKKHNLGYDDSYKVSATFLTERLLNHGGYDLIIDFHRDSVSKSATTLQTDSKSYAKVMFVIGETSKHVNRTKAISRTLSSYLDESVDGISRGLYGRACTYNQDMTENMILMEIGGQYNTFEEVRNTLDLLSNAIDRFLQEEL